MRSPASPRGLVRGHVWPVALTACVVVSSTLWSATARPMHAEIDYPRYLASQDILTAELDEWLAVFGQDAAANGWLPRTNGNRLNALHEADHHEDWRQRLFLTKELIARLQPEHPGLELSIMTPFSLLTVSEFAVRFLRHRPHVTGAQPQGNTTSPVPTPRPVNTTQRRLAAQATGADWSTHACNGPVQIQGSCSSSWAFAAVGIVDFAKCLADPGHALVKYSEQQVVSCDTRNSGCNGGYESDALAYIQRQGLCTTAEYPYKSLDGTTGQCNAASCRKTSIGIKIKQTLGATDSGLVEELRRAPVTVAVRVDYEIWKQYKAGVVTACPNGNDIFAAMAVGFDDESIKLKNSWGSDWGEGGYIRLRREDRNGGTCGLLEDVSSVEVACVDPVDAVETWRYDGAKAEVLRGCANPDGDAKDWVMLRAYRRGGTENVHWKYVREGDDTSGCLRNWRYYDSDGTTLLATVEVATTMGDSRPWCALPVYRRGGKREYQWAVCPCSCSTPTEALAKWRFNGQIGTLTGCASPDGDKDRWVMLNAYRAGGTENVHWKYIVNGDTSGCLRNWKYYAADGTTLLETVAVATSRGDSREWCALPVYRPGGQRGRQYAYCQCS